MTLLRARTHTHTHKHTQGAAVSGFLDRFLNAVESSSSIASATPLNCALIDLFVDSDPSAEPSADPTRTRPALTLHPCSTDRPRGYFIVTDEKTGRPRADDIQPEMGGARAPWTPDREEDVDVGGRSEAEGNPWIPKTGPFPRHSM